MQRDDDWDDGETAGAIRKDPTESTGAGKAKVHSGNHAVVGAVDPAVSPGAGGSRRQLKKMRLARERKQARALIPVADWNALPTENAALS